MISKLSKNLILVLKLLENHKKPLSAYKILDSLREHGFNAPLQVYRALNLLIKIIKGSIERQSRSFLLILRTTIKGCLFKDLISSFLLGGLIIE